MAGNTSVVIVNWNGAKFLDNLLQSVLRCKPRQIIVVDNASADNSGEILARHPEVQIIQNDANAGFGKAANQGIRQSDAPFILLLNADIEVLPGSLNRLQKFLEENPLAGAAAPQLTFPNGTIQPSCRTFPTLPKIFLYLSFLDRLLPTGYRLPASAHEALREVDQPMGAALLLKREAIEKAGLFDERFFLYMEDVDLCERLKDAGYKIFLVPESRMIHYAGGSSNQEWARSQKNYVESLIQYFQKRTDSAFRLGLTRFWLSLAFVLRSGILLVGGQKERAGFYFRMATSVFKL